MENRLHDFIAQLPQDIDAALITSDINRLYYTGFSSSAGILLVTREKSYLLIDFRYIEAARSKVPGIEVILQEKLSRQLAELLSKHNAVRVGVESAWMTLSEYRRYSDFMPNVELVWDNCVSELIEKQRSVKSPQELSLIAQAQDITDQTFTHILDYIRPGISERELMLEMEFYSRKIGSECASFDFIVVSGIHSSMPHGVPTEKLLETGDFITMDFGAVIGGYHSDMTRTVALGTVCEEQKRIYEVTLAAQLAALESIKPGVPCNAIDGIARTVITEAGYGDCFGHGLGHSVGLEIHESPAFNLSNATVCEAGHVMTVEPGIYLEGKFGCRIEDMVYITPNGCQNLAKSSKNLLIL